MTIKEIELNNISLEDLDNIRDKLISFGYICRGPFVFILTNAPDFTIMPYKCLHIYNPKMLQDKRVKHLLVEYLI